MTVRVRIAPSPTGDPHVGTAYVAAFNRAWAKKNNGTFILRIEDTDRERFNPDSERMIFDALHWLGLDWEEGPDVGGENGPYRQSERLSIYRKHVDELVAKGDAYPCFCTPEQLKWMRQEQMRQKQPPGYDRRCRGIPVEEARKRVENGNTHVIRLAVPLEGETRFTDLPRGEIVFQNREIDDQVLLKSDGFPTYHLANVVDDRLMGVTHIIRGEEWLSSVPKHMLMYAAFGWDPPVMCHLPLLRNPDKSKVSKRKNPVSILWYKEQGFLPEAMVNFLALMGGSMLGDQEVFTFEEWSNAFDLKKVGVAGPVFDLQKLEWLNGEYIRKKTPEELIELLKKEKALPPGAENHPRLPEIVTLVQERMKFLSEFPESGGFFFGDDVRPLPEEIIPKKRDRESTLKVLPALIARYEKLDDWRRDPLEETAIEVMEEAGWKKGDIFMMTRVAVTGKTATPPICESMEVLGKDMVLKRLRTATALLQSSQAQA